MKRWIIGGILALLLFACTPAVEQGVNETTANESEGVQFGDLVSVNFKLYLENGTLVDTNNPELAEKNNLKNYVKGPYKFILGQSGKVKGFDDAITGLDVGEKGTAIIEPSEEELVVKVSRIKYLERFIALPINQRIPIKTYQTAFGKEPFIGDVVFNEELQFKYQVVNFTNRTVLAKMIVAEKEEYTLPNTEWVSKVARVAKNDVMFYQSPEENQTVSAPFGDAKITLTKSRIILRFNPVLNKIFNRSVEISSGFTIPAQFQVIEITDDDFIIKRYGLLTDKKLTLEVEILESIPNVKKVKKKESVITEIVTTDSA